MKSAHEQVAERASQDLKLHGIKGCNVSAGHYKYKGKLAEQIRLNCSTPESLMKAKLVVNYVKWADLTPTTAASGDRI